MEAQILLQFHRWRSAFLDAAFSVSHELGTVPFCTLLVVTAAVAYRRQRRIAALWIGVGLSTFVIQAGLKALIQRPRPALWAPIVPLPGKLFAALGSGSASATYAFPSGHALAAATFFPLIGAGLITRYPAWRMPIIAIVVGLVVFVGTGRLYLGFHWPTDVLAGWTLGAIQFGVALVLLRRWEDPNPC